jgi:hypothetical protein
MARGTFRTETALLLKTRYFIKTEMEKGGFAIRKTGIFS